MTLAPAARKQQREQLQYADDQVQPQQRRRRQQQVQHIRQQRQQLRGAGRGRDRGRLQLRVQQEEIKSSPGYQHYRQNRRKQTQRNGSHEDLSSSRVSTGQHYSMDSELVVRICWKVSLFSEMLLLFLLTHGWRSTELVMCQNAIGANIQNSV